MDGISQQGVRRERPTRAALRGFIVCSSCGRTMMKLGPSVRCLGRLVTARLSAAVRNSIFGPIAATKHAESMFDAEKQTGSL